MVIYTPPITDLIFFLSGTNFNHMHNNAISEHYSSVSTVKKTRDGFWITFEDGLKTFQPFDIPEDTAAIIRHREEVILQLCELLTRNRSRKRPFHRS
jgi:hypothetical protein